MNEKGKFECHITCDVKDKEAVKSVGKLVGWFYSAFDADPLMGSKPFVYLTQYGAHLSNLKLDAKAVGAALGAYGVKVLRTKIERIVFDTKTGVDETFPEVG